jgi:hypothetical protein
LNKYALKSILLAEFNGMNMMNGSNQFGALKNVTATLNSLNSKSSKKKFFIEAIA